MVQVWNEEKQSIVASPRICFNISVLIRDLLLFHDVGQHLLVEAAGLSVFLDSVEVNPSELEDFVRITSDVDSYCNIIDACESVVDVCELCIIAMLFRKDSLQAAFHNPE